MMSCFCSGDTHLLLPSGDQIHWNRNQLAQGTYIHTDVVVSPARSLCGFSGVDLELFVSWLQSSCFALRPNVCWPSFYLPLVL